MRWFGLGAAVVLGLAGCGKDADSSTPNTGAPTGSTGTGSTSAVSCDPAAIPTLPLQVTERIGGFTGAEDFAFDLDGNYVATDDGGNIVRISRDASAFEVWSPAFGESSGTAFLPDGTLAIGNVERGVVQRIRKNGGTGRLLGGMSYPNGLAVHPDNIVFAADQNTGEILRYDVDADERSVLATDLYSPNGLALSPDYGTLYVGSFGGGTVHAIDLETGAVTLFGQTPGGSTSTGGADDCAARAAGDECWLEFVGLGTCVSDGTGLACEWVGDRDACQGLAEGDPCTTTTLGQPNDSICQPVSGAPGELFCPEVPADVVQACVGLSEYDSCEAQGVTRDCRRNWEDILVCDVTRWNDVSEEACQGQSGGDDCVILDVEGYADGTCQQGYYGGLTCDPGWYGGGGYTFHGGLDGVQVDVCGYVWVTEYTFGYVWRFPPEGGEPELAVETGTFWIPNMHWGTGVGGWELDTMYMQDRFTDELLVIPVGLPGVPTALELSGGEAR